MGTKITLMGEVQERGHVTFYPVLFDNSGQTVEG